jgi:DNA (cytosine-5)-methyltransferase 1
MGDPTTDNYVVTGGFFDQETFANSGQGYWNDAKETPPVGTQARAIYESTLVTHSPRADGFDASEDGTGRGTPLVPVAMLNMQGSKGNSVAQEDGPSYTLNAMHGHDVHAIAFSCKDSGLDSSSISPTLRSMNFSSSHANAGGQVAIAMRESAICENPLAGPDGVGIRTDDQAYTVEARQVPQAVAFVQNTRDEVRLMGGDGQSVGALAAEPGMKQQCYTAFNLRGREGGSLPEPAPGNQASLRSASGGSSRSYVAQAIGLDEEQNATEDGMGCLKARREGGGFEGSVMTPAMQVRRLTTVECARLQGFPDDYLNITYNSKPAADGPKYKALGNSFAVPVVRWIGQRLQLIDLFS